MSNSKTGSGEPHNPHTESADAGTSTATLTLQVSNPHGIVCFVDVLAELFRMHEVEKNAKNEAYHFILSHGHFETYRKFNRTYRGKDIDHHTESVKCLIDMATEVETSKTELP